LLSSTSNQKLSDLIISLCPFTCIPSSQRRFKANPVPHAVKEQVFSTLQASWEAKRVAARVKQQLSREKARARLEQSFRAR
jgi:hypothetical protein